MSGVVGPTIIIIVTTISIIVGAATIAALLWWWVDWVTTSAVPEPTRIIDPNPSPLERKILKQLEEEFPVVDPLEEIILEIKEEERREEVERRRANLGIDVRAVKPEEMADLLFELANNRIEKRREHKATLQEAFNAAAAELAMTSSYKDWREDGRMEFE